MSQTELHITTPVFESMSMRAITGKNIYVKMDCYQPTGSFKIRGIGALCQKSYNEGARHFVSSSGGNAGHAVAFSGRKLGAKVTVFVPRATNTIFRNRICSEGAELIVAGEVWDDAHQAALEFIKTERDAAYVPPFDHEEIWNGHESIFNELNEQMDKPDAIVLSIGGGGLMCGLLQGMHKHGWDKVPVIAVETQGAASLKAAMEAGRVVTLENVQSIATTLGAKRIADRTFEWTQKHKIIPVQVSDFDAVRACRQFADGHHTLVEPACGAALSVIYDNLPVLRPYSRILAIACGGVGISLELLERYLRDTAPEGASQVHHLR